MDPGNDEGRPTTERPTTTTLDPGAKVTRPAATAPQSTRRRHRTWTSRQVATFIELAFSQAVHQTRAEPVAVVERECQDFERRVAQLARVLENSGAGRA